MVTTKIIKFLCCGVFCLSLLCGCNSSQYEDSDFNKEADLTATVSDSQISNIEADLEDEDGKDVQTTQPSVVEVSDEELEVIYEKCQEDLLAFWQVLNSKKPFISINEGSQEFYWNEYFWHDGAPVTKYTAGLFMIVDMDGDGGKEIVLYCSPEATQVFHYEDGKVYGYQFNYRGMNSIGIDGIYMGSSGASTNTCNRIIEFNKDGYVEETLASMDDNYYKIGDKQVSEEEINEYFQGVWASEKAEELIYNDDILAQYLLNGLSKEEISILQNVSTENMEKLETDYPMEADIRQAYYDVLLGKKEFISVADGNQSFYLNDYYLERGNYNKDFRILYFSIVDMDQDGIYEIVLTCHNMTTQILHYEDGEVYSYQFSYYSEIGAIANNGIFETYVEGQGRGFYGRIVSFDKKECKMEVVDAVEDINGDRIRYYIFSEEMIDELLK